jgi:hypothetical protein
MRSGWAPKCHLPISLLCPQRFWSIINGDRSVSKSIWLRVIFRVFPFQFEVYSLDSSKTISKFPAVFNFKRLFLKLNRLICNEQLVLPTHRIGLQAGFDLPNLCIRNRMVDVSQLVSLHAHEIAQAWHCTRSACLWQWASAVEDIKRETCRTWK